MESYNFGDAASALYDFWLKDFCDIYLEAVKPAVYAKDDSKEKMTAKNVLYRCLSDGLKLLHPIMPFITEELYQRLPVTPTTMPSICIAKYPIGCKAFENTAIDNQMELVMNVVKTLRSSMTALNVPKKDKPNVFIHAKKADEAEVIAKNTGIVISLAKVGKCVVVDKPMPDGCTRQVASLNCDVYIEVKGLIDTTAEVVY